MVGEALEMVQAIDTEVSDIYGRKLVRRQVAVTQSDLQHGNSGGPLVDGPGAVIGMVFGASTTQPGIGYALTNSEMRPDLLAAHDRTQAV